MRWGTDAGSNMATVTGDAAAPGDTTTPTPDTSATTDYSDWTAEEEAAYQEFKGMWEVDAQNGIKIILGSEMKSNLLAFIQNSDILKCEQRLAVEAYDLNKSEEVVSRYIGFYYGDHLLWTDHVFSTEQIVGGDATRSISSYNEESVVSSLSEFI